MGESPSRKSMPLAESATHALLEDLERRWTGASLFVAPGAADGATPRRPRGCASACRASTLPTCRRGRTYARRRGRRCAVRIRQALGTEHHHAARARQRRRSTQSGGTGHGRGRDGRPCRDGPGRRISFVRHGSTPRARARRAGGDRAGDRLVARDDRVDRADSRARSLALERAADHDALLAGQAGTGRREDRRGPVLHRRLAAAGRCRCGRIAQPARRARSRARRSPRGASGTRARRADPLRFADRAGAGLRAAVAANRKPATVEDRAGEFG